MLRFQVIGNLGADAEVKNMNGRMAVVFNVAHTDRWTDEAGTKHESTTWVSCKYNGDGGKLLQYLKKGTMVYVEGSGSARVFSSEKQRKMVAGLNLTVSHIELVGGSNTDEVPRNLADSQGLLYPVFKAYFLSAEATKQLKAPTWLQDPRGNRFNVSAEGWVTPDRTTPQPTQQDAQQDAPFTATFDNHD